MKVINAPSLANCDCLQMGEDIRQLAENGIEFLHIDLMDGHYVPNLCLPPNYIGDIKRAYPYIETDIHLMVSSPADYLERLKEQGADYVAFHADATPFVRRTLTQIRALGMKAGVAINPSQRIDCIEPYASLLDYVVLMTVEPGFAGQRFLPDSFSRLEELAHLRSKLNASFLIEIDGGVDYENIPALLRLGSDILVTGVYVVFRQPDGIPGACKRFRELTNNL